jgi:hypothetical protein
MNLEGNRWETLDRFVEIRSKWLTLIGEHLLDNRGQKLDYWRVERVDTIVVLPILDEHLILPIPSYRPGLKELTLDFPGGRVPEGRNPIDVVPETLQRELDIATEAITKITPINTEGWAVNSSFSNQKLYGFVVNFHANTTVPQEQVGATYPITKEGISSLLKDLTCLQCRALLLEWLRQSILS